MKLKTLIAGIFTLLITGTAVSTQSLTPQLIGVGGSTAQQPEGSLSWATGEPITGTLRGASAWLTQGFLQGHIQVTNTDLVSGLEYSVKAFPNPTTYYLTLEIGYGHPQNMFYRLFDMGGLLLAEAAVEGTQTRITVSHLRPSAYLLKVYASGQVISTFKIIKQ
jgi:hypothetical protein